MQVRNWEGEARPVALAAALGCGRHSELRALVHGDSYGWDHLVRGHGEGQLPRELRALHGHHQHYYEHRGDGPAVKPLHGRHRPSRGLLARSQFYGQAKAILLFPSHMYTTCHIWSC